MVAFLLFTILGDLVLSFLVARVDYRLYTDREFMNWIGAAAQYLIGFPICVLIMKQVPKDPMERRSLRVGEILIYIPILIMLLHLGSIIGMMVNQLLSMVLGFPPRDILTESLEGVSIPFMIITSVIAAPICEEVIFRRCLLDRLNRLGDAACVFLSGLFFAMIHGNFYQFFYAMLVGCMFAYIYLRTGKLRYTIALHMMINLLFGVVSQLLYEWSQVNVMGDLVSYMFSGATFSVGLLGLILFQVYRRRAVFLKSWMDLPEEGWLPVSFPNVGMILLILVCVVQFILYL